MICYDDACSRKREAPSPAPGPVECAEIVVKFVLLETQLIRNAEGQPVLSAAAFPNDTEGHTWKVGVCFKGKTYRATGDRSSCPSDEPRAEVVF